MKDIVVSDFLIIRTSTQKKLSNQLINPNEITFDKNRLDAINELKSCCNNNDFLMGVVFSTEHLYESYKKYFLDASPANLNKKQRQTIKSLLLYYTRATYNSTPFNFFTEISHYHLTNKNHVLNESIQVEPNMFFIRHVFDFVYSSVERFPVVQLKLNESVIEVGNMIEYYYPNINDIAFNKLKKNALVDEFLRIMRSNRTLSFSDLTQKIQSVFSNSNEEIVELIKRFLNMGLLKIHSGFNALTSSNKLDELAYFLTEIENENGDLTELIRLVKFMKNISESIRTVDSPDSINQKLNIVYNNLLSFFTATANKYGLENYVFPFKKYNLLYVDKIAENTGLNISKDHLEQQLLLIDNMLWKFPAYDSNITKRKNYFEFYKRKFNDSEKVSLKEFYLTYHEFIEENEANYQVLTQPVSEAKKIFAEELKGVLNKLLSESENETVSIKISNVPICKTPYSNFLNQQSSHSVYYSFTNDDKMALHSISSGYGRAESRFLPILDPEIASNLLKSNIEACSPDIPVEISDFSFFNANLHSELADYEIEISEGHSYSDKTKKIVLNDIYVGIDQHTIFLMNEQEEKLVPLNINLQSEEQRSLLFKFLITFNPQKHLDFSIINQLWTEVNVNRSGGQGIVMVPPLLLEDKIVLFAKYWIVKYTLSEIYNLNGSPQSRHEKFMSFLDENKISYVGYIQFEDEKQYSEPFFMNLSNPLYFELFEKLYLDRKIFIIHEDPSKEGNSQGIIATYYSNKTPNVQL